MNIEVNMTVDYVKQNGTAEQKAAAVYFDKNGNGIYEQDEADTFSRSSIEKTDEALTITSADGYVDTFENIATRHDDEYYSSGTIPVAVIDDYLGNLDNPGYCQHGTYVCNTIKSINPDISITKINNSERQYWTPAQKFVNKVFETFPALGNLLCSNESTQNMLDEFFCTDKYKFNASVKAFEELNNQIENGAGYKAVNLSSACACEYSEINELVAEELGVAITPDNIAEYKSEIKEILRQKSDEQGKDGTFISQILTQIDLLENTEIPVYMGGSYTSEDGEDTFNLLALADNALIVEGGVEYGNDIIFDEDIPHSSLALDENGERRIEDSRLYDGKELLKTSTSFATPMALAKAFPEE